MPDSIQQSIQPGVPLHSGALVVSHAALSRSSQSDRVLYYPVESTTELPGWGEFPSGMKCYPPETVPTGKIPAFRKQRLETGMAPLTMTAHPLGNIMLLVPQNPGLYMLKGFCLLRRMKQGAH